MSDDTEVQVPENEVCEASKKCGCRRVAVGLVLFFVVVMLLLPAVSSAPEAAKRRKCINNLKQIMLATLNYRDKYGCYPPAYTVDKQGRRMHSWRALVLEFLDPELYKKYDFSRPWDSPGNLAVADMMKKDGPYHCPYDVVKSPLTTSYVMLVGPQAFSDGPTGRTLDDIEDGAANTIAVVEMSSSGIVWTEPRDLEVPKMSFKINDPNRPCIRSCHANGANIVFADGAVMFIGDSVYDNILKAMTTINGKEDVSRFGL